MTTLEPAYRQLACTGELRRRVEQAYDAPRRLRPVRVELPRGPSRPPRRVPHGDARRRIELWRAPRRRKSAARTWLGSGTIFFAWCNLKCQFCQNYEISQLGEGREAQPQEIATMMLDLQEAGCHNINFVSPSHVVAQILAAVAIAAEAGLRVPLVWNTGGYDSLTALQLLDGVVDIYMPDLKYADAKIAQRLSKAKDYPAVNRAAVKEMHRQVGDLVMDERGVAQRGLLVRHLVLPEGLAGTAEVARFLAQEISRDTYVNVMAQYRPCYRASQIPSLDRSITRAEYAEAVAVCRAAGLHRFDK